MFKTNVFVKFSYLKESLVKIDCNKLVTKNFN